MRLTSADDPAKRIERFFLHTWDTNYISGYAKWKGTPYGQYYVKTSDR